MTSGFVDFAREFVHHVAAVTLLDLPYFSRLAYIGSGAYGVVFAATLNAAGAAASGLPVGSKVAVKSMPGSLLNELPEQCVGTRPYLSLRVAREVFFAVEVGRSGHPRFPKAYGVYCNAATTPRDAPAGADVYFVMELAEEGTLEKIPDSLEYEEKTALARGCVESVAQLHAWGVAHRDIKASNFLVTRRNGKLWVLCADFGLSRPTTGSAQSSNTIGVGTQPFMPPEALALLHVPLPGMAAVPWMGGDSVGQSGDLWSLAIVLCMLVDVARVRTQVLCGGVPRLQEFIGAPTAADARAVREALGVTDPSFDATFRELFSAKARVRPPTDISEPDEVVLSMLRWAPSSRTRAAEVLEMAWMEEVEPPQRAAIRDGPTLALPELTCPEGGDLAAAMDVVRSYVLGLATAVPPDVLAAARARVG